MTPADIRRMLNDEDKAALRRSGRKPLVAAYRVAHEGASFGSVRGLGRAPKRWGSAQVAELADKMRGAPVYVGHRTGAGTRPAVGYVLRARPVAGAEGAEAVAVVAVENPAAASDIAAGGLDVASVEADLWLEPGKEALTVRGVESVTGLALAGAKKHSPGFPRAQLLAYTRELEGEEEDGGGEAPSKNERASRRDEVIRASLERMNLSDAERRFVYKRVAERAPEPDAVEDTLMAEVNIAINALDEAKRIYRRPPPPMPAPAERRTGPTDYTSPEHNDLIPRRR